MCTMKIMHTMASEAIAPRPKRRYYSPELKSQVVAECHITGASVASVALAQGINANIVHRWLREQTAERMPALRNEFVALTLPPAVEQRPASASEPASPSRDSLKRSTKKTRLLTASDREGEFTTAPGS